MILSDSFEVMLHREQVCMIGCDTAITFAFGLSCSNVDVRLSRKEHIRHRLFVPRLR